MSGKVMQLRQRITETRHRMTGKVKQLLEDHWPDVLVSLGLLTYTGVTVRNNLDCLQSVEMKYLAGTWAIAPPLYFLLQWTRYTPDLKEKKEEFEIFKLSQERARDLWLAGATLLGAIVLGK